MNKAREKARNSSCTSNLKGLTSAAIMYSDEYNGELPLYYDNVNPWLYHIVDGNLNHALMKAAFCPSGEPVTAGNEFYMVYGIHFGHDGNAMKFSTMAPREPSRSAVTAVNSRFLNRSPSQMPLFGDSRKVGSKVQWHTMLALNMATNEGLVTVRHSMRANLAFFDGHVSNFDRPGLYGIGYRYIVDHTDTAISIW
ncbi:MAG: DUF1559 domain-containing protein [Desulfobacterales bacterium]|nr:DUF1559 domain-containing protein [Desulfobacterales bacterium]